DRLRLERRQFEAPRPRADRGQEPPGRVTDEEEERPRRRLLEHFEERVGGVRVHVVGWVDDGDAPARLAAGRAEERYRPADFGDGQLGAVAAGVLVKRPLQREKVRMRPVGDAAEG